MKKLKPGIALKSILFTILLLFVFALVLNFAVGRSIYDATSVLLSSTMTHSGRIIRRQIDADRLGQPDYNRELDEYLEGIRKDVRADVISIFCPDESDPGRFTCFAHARRPGMEDLFGEPGDKKEMFSPDFEERCSRLYEYDLELASLEAGKAQGLDDNYMIELMPVRGSDGQMKGMLCIFSSTGVLGLIRKEFASGSLYVLIGVTIIVIIAQSLFSSRMLIRPLKKITSEAERFARENTKARSRLTDTIKSSDEIGVLAGSIDRMEQQISEYVEDITAITAERERIATELELAARIQANMLPNRFPAFPERSEFDIYASMDPAKEVGGDFYDFFLIDDDHLCLLIADVSGKGIPAAMFMMAARNELVNNARMGKSPAQILAGTNASICANNPEEMFVTVWLGILTISTGIVKAASAGHEYPALQKPGGEFELLEDPHGLVIGVMEGMKYREYEIVMEPGSRLFVYTDGVPEATAADLELFGTGRMIGALNKVKGSSPQEILKGVRKAVDDFVKDAEQFDDLTMLCLEIR